MWSMSDDCLPFIAANFKKVPATLPGISSEKVRVAPASDCERKSSRSRQSDPSPFLVGSAMLINDIAAQAATRLNLTRGRDNIWRGCCPVCGYAKPSLEIAVQRDRIVIRCTVCGADASIARMIGLPSELVAAPSTQP